MFYLFFRTVLLFAIGALLCIPANAQEPATQLPMPVYDGLCVLLLVIALLVAGCFAHRVFEVAIPTPDYNPAPPRYMTLPRQHRRGMIAYVTLCLIAYMLIVAFYSDLAPFFAPLEPTAVDKLAQTYIKGGQISFPAIVILAIAALLTLLRIDQEWNPFLILRRVVWSWVSVPELANTIKADALNDLTVPEAARKKVASDPKNHVDIDDFKKDKTTLDRRWAELCYVRLWLRSNFEEGKHNTFFYEPTFHWETLEKEFYAVRDRITRAKQAPKSEDTFEREVFDAIASRAEALRSKYCSLAAFFILFKNATKKAAVDDAGGFGVKIATDEARENPIPYIVMFILAIVASIYLGVWVSATIWDLACRIMGAAVTSSEMARNGAVATSWVYYGLATYGAPIAVALMLRYATWKYDAEQPDSYPTSYAVIVAVSLCVSVASLMLATMLGSGPHANDPWTDLVSRDFKWGWAPALISLYIVYHIDRQIDPLLPDIGKLGGEGVSHRLLACFFFAVLVTLLSALPAASLEAQHDSVWSIEKLQTVVLGTIFTIGFVMALVSQFCLVKPREQATAGTSTASASALQPTS
jgi:hypothetical protein